MKAIMNIRIPIFAVLLTMLAGLLAPAPGFASANGRKNTAIGLTAGSLYFLLHRNTTLGLLGGAGAAVAWRQYNIAQKHAHMKRGYAAGYSAGRSVSRSYNSPSAHHYYGVTSAHHASYVPHAAASHPAAVTQASTAPAWAYYPSAAPALDLAPASTYAPAALPVSAGVTGDTSPQNQSTAGPLPWAVGIIALLVGAGAAYIAARPEQTRAALRDLRSAHHPGM